MDGEASSTSAVSAGPPPPATDTAWAVATARDVLARGYGIAAGTVVRLGGEIDVNLAVSGTDGQRVVVKIGAPGTDLAHLHWQHDLLDALDGRPDLPPVPRILRAADGSAVTLVDDIGGRRPVRVQTWLPGRTLAELDHHSPELLRDWGRAAAQLVAALPADPPPGVPATHHWEAVRAREAVDSQLWAVRDASRRADVEVIMARFDTHVAPVLDDLPRQVVHQDLNDFNVLASPGPDRRHRLSGVLDFTDAIHTARVSELAIAVAYAMLDKADPLDAAAEVVRGYCALLPLADAELRALPTLAAARLCVNATTWTAREPHNGEYARARMQYTWPTIARLAATPADVAEAWLRAAAGDTRTPPAAHVAAALPAPCGRATPAGGFLEPTGTLPLRRTRDGVPATLRLGIDLAPGAPGLPVDGVVECADSGAVVVRHEVAGRRFWARWVPATGGPGTHLPAGRTPATGPVRLCLFTSAEAARLAPLDAVTWTSAAAWRAVCPDPGPAVGLPPAQAPIDAVALRGQHVASSQRAYYADPPQLVSSRDVWLRDDRGLAYLDAINNVSHVGHATPAVVGALAAQAARLNTNSRFVFDGLSRYAARLADLLPDPLEVVFLVCTGSEANDLALRIARQVTAREDVLIIDGAYHGNTGAVTAISPNRYKGPGGRGAPPTTHETVMPDRYRGPYGYDDPHAGERYAADAAAVVSRLAAQGRPPAAFVAESLMGTAGTIVHPPGYLAGAFAAVRAHGGLCVSDEVQVGFGRLGSRFWGFQTQGVVPDIVTMGKPIGNGHPLAAVVTTRAVADAFDTGMKYFNTFGGNPVSCAVGDAVLDEIERRDLQRNAAGVGAYLRERLAALAQRHELIGDVRGEGLYLGVDLVRDRTTKEPASAEARHVSERMKDEGVIVYPTGTGDNVLKIKPPLTFTREHADLFTVTLDRVLTGDW